MSNRVLRWNINLLMKLADWEEAPWLQTTQSAGPYKVLLWRIAGVFLATYAAAVALASWQDGSAKGNPIVDILSGAAWISAFVLLIVFVLFSLLAASRHLAGRPRDQQSVEGESSASVKSKDDST